MVMISHMDQIVNPYAPGAGQRPPDLAGRETEREAFGILLERLRASRPERGIMFTGLRGVGKTVLLEEFRSRAEQSSWIVAYVEAGMGRPFRLLAAQALTRSLRATSLRHRSSAKLSRAMRVFKSFSLKASPDGSVSIGGVDIEPERGRADSGDLELDLTELLVDLGEAASDFDAGAVLFVDELQDLPQADVAAIAGKSLHKVHDLTKPQGVRGRNSDNTKLREVLGWEPATPLHDGLEPTYRWIESQLRPSGRLAARTAQPSPAVPLPATSNILPAYSD